MSDPRTPEDEQPQPEPTTPVERFDLMAIKGELNAQLGEKQTDYWEAFLSFLKLKISKLELDYIVTQLLGDEKSRVSFSDGALLTQLCSAIPQHVCGSIVEQRTLYVAYQALACGCS